MKAVAPPQRVSAVARRVQAGRPTCIPEAVDESAGRLAEVDPVTRSAHEEESRHVRTLVIGVRQRKLVLALLVFLDYAGAGAITTGERTRVSRSQ